MIEQYIYCLERPSTQEVRAHVTPFGFIDDEDIEWPLKLRAPPDKRPIYIAGKSDVILCYEPAKVAIGESPSQLDHARSTFCLFTDGEASIEDDVFIGMMAGHLATKYRGSIYDSLSDRICSMLRKESSPVSGQIPIPEEVWSGLEAVRLSGLTNMLDRNAVSEIADVMGYPSTSRWISTHKKEYSEGIFKGFLPTRDE